MIKVENLKKVFGDKTAIDILELNIEKGSIVGLVGNNGAGKTTFFRLILDLLKAECGCVLSNGQNVAKSEEWKTYTGAFIDSRFLIEFLTPEEYFYFVGETYGYSKQQVDEALTPFARFMNNEILNQNNNSDNQ